MDNYQQTDPCVEIINGNHFEFSINKKEKTASIIRIKEKTFKICREIIIPQSINYLSEDYTITRIKGSVYHSLERLGNSIEAINFPSTVLDIEEGFIYATSFKGKIIFDPNNPRYTSWDDNQLVLAKSKIDQSNYDTIVYCSKHAKITIPDFIEIISPYAFSHVDFEFFQISENSNLRIINEFAFLDSYITKFTIPPHLTTIKRGAFLGCYTLRKLIYPKDNKSELHTIEADAFYDTNITEFTIPSKLTNLEEGWCKNVKFGKITIDEKNPNYYLYDNKFVISKSKENNNSLIYCIKSIKAGNLIIPDFIESIEPYSFNFYHGDSISFSNESKIRTIKQYAFTYSKIFSISFPRSLKYISDSSFAESTEINSINFDENSELEEIGPNSFFNICIGRIKSIVLPKTVKKIGEKAFYNCYNLECFQIPYDSNLQVIEYGAFAGTQIKKLYIPSNLQQLKDGWCCKTSKLESIEISPDNKAYCFSGDKKMIFGKSNDSNNFNVIVFACRDVKSVKIPSFIEIIGECSFSYCKQLDDVQFSSDTKLRKIEKSSFYSSSIKKFTLPSGVTCICDFAFSFCDKLEEFEINADSKLTCIGRHAFSYSSISKIELPSQLQFLGRQSFCHCANLESVKLPNNSNLRKIEDRTFSQCVKLKHIDFQNINKIEIFEKESFKFCTQLENFTIPSSVTQICESAFANCSKLQVEFTNDTRLQKISDLSFLNTGIKYVKIPESVTFIGISAFGKCDNLYNVEFPPDSQLQSIGKRAFEYTHLKCISIPKHFKKIPDFMFDDCHHLERVEIQDDCEIQSIGYKGFAETAIGSFKITRNVKYIGSFAFYNCDSLKIIEVDENSELLHFDILYFPSVLIMIPVKASEVFKTIGIG